VGFFLSIILLYICIELKNITTMIYKSSSETIKGYKTSKLARTEKNDCVVRTLATAFGLTYNQSHKFCGKTLYRKNGKGVNTWTYHIFLSKGSAFNKTITEIKYEPVQVLRDKGYYERYDTLELYIKRGKKYSKMTVGSFIKNHPKGTFIISVKGHTFAIKDSVVCGNFSDFRKARVIVQKAWEIN